MDKSAKVRLRMRQLGTACALTGLMSLAYFLPKTDWRDVDAVARLIAMFLIVLLGAWMVHDARAT